MRHHRTSLNECFFNNLARDLAKPIEIRCAYILTDDEINTIKNSRSEFVQDLVSARAGLGFSNPTALLQFLQSPPGQMAKMQAATELTTALTRIETNKLITLGLSMNAPANTVDQVDPLSGPIIAFLDQRLPPSLSFFSYFPADRALPMGEVGMQFGGPDAQQQLESHNSQPQLKYQRLKTLIINSLLVASSPDGSTIQQDFEKIFSGLLQGRRIVAINTNELGLLSIMTQEISSGRLIELDGLSSGEKNIALTFLLVRRSIARAGIALFDEPELHLNPAVSRDLIPFVMKEYSKGRDIQFIMCTHSPEVLSGAFKDEDCNLLHLKSSSDITRIGKHAIEEYSEALRRLGTSVSDTLFYEGTILVEGDDDVSFLEIGFPDLLKKYQIKDRGGRREVEKAVAEIQKLEQRGEKVAPIFLIFDRDDEPTGLMSSNAVRILQWPKRAIENYMLDIDVISELLKDPDVTKAPIASAGAVDTLLRDLALKQLDSAAARQVYRAYGYLNSSATKDEFKSDELSVIAAALYDRMSNSRNSMPDVNKDDWIQRFNHDVGVKRNELLAVWEAKWKDVCDGKKLMSELHREAKLKISIYTFKERVLRRMRDITSDNWKLAKASLEELLKPPAER
jgi:AAA domain, putative AbiEii toxin, Type IV TA system/Protein of unknown function (DUF4435)